VHCNILIVIHTNVSCMYRTVCTSLLPLLNAYGVFRWSPQSEADDHIERFSTLRVLDERILLQ